jgi:hypothetical protein
MSDDRKLIAAEAHFRTADDDFNRALDKLAAAHIAYRNTDNDEAAFNARENALPAVMEGLSDRTAAGLAWQEARIKSDGIKHYEIGRAKLRRMKVH